MNISIIKLINAYYTRNVQNPRADDVYMLTNVIACCSFCDVGHATIGLTNLENYSVQRYLILNIRHNKIPYNAHIHNLRENRSA